MTANHDATTPTFDPPHDDTAELRMVWVLGVSQAGSDAELVPDVGGWEPVPMRTYGQYCPIARASELLAERWSVIILRNVVILGCGRSMRLRMARLACRGVCFRSGCGSCSGLG